MSTKSQRMKIKTASVSESKKDMSVEKLTPKSSNPQGTNCIIDDFSSYEAQNNKDLTPNHLAQSSNHNNSSLQQQMERPGLNNKLIIDDISSSGYVESQ